MGIMPVDREQQWQRLFRRFGLPGDVRDKDSGSSEVDGRRQVRPDAGKRPAPPRNDGRETGR